MGYPTAKGFCPRTAPDLWVWAAAAPSGAPQTFWSEVCSFCPLCRMCWVKKNPKNFTVPARPWSLLGSQPWAEPSAVA